MVWQGVPSSHTTRAANAIIMLRVSRERKHMRLDCVTPDLEPQLLHSISAHVRHTSAVAAQLTHTACCHQTQPQLLAATKNHQTHKPADEFVHTIDGCMRSVGDLVPAALRHGAMLAAPRSDRT
eukprot:352416-Chlamydomonas_euryale.AAC.1